MTSVRRSLALSFLEKYASLVIQLGSGLVIARLITPEAFGTFAIAYAIVGFAHVIREMGVSSYLIQLPELEPHHIRAALFATGVVAWSLGLVLFAASPLVARFYGEEVRQTTLILLVSFAIMPLSSTIMATLQREMDFVALLRINLAGTIVGAGVGILLAAHGLGAAGLAWASVAGQAAIGIVAAAHRPLPAHFQPSRRGAVAVFRFGSLVMGASLLHQCSTNVASLITARFVSLEAMGMFSRAQSVTAMFDRLLMSGVGPLLLPHLAQQRRGGHDAAESFWQAFGYLSALTWPFFLFVSLYATPIVHVLFGDQWLPAADLLRLIALGGPFWLIGCLVPPLLTALGHVGLILRVQVVAQLVAVIGVGLTAPHGVGAVALAAIPISAAHGLIWLWVLRRLSPDALGPMWERMRSGAMVTLAALAMPALLMAGAFDVTAIVELALGLAGAAVGWLVGIFIAGNPLSRELQRLIDSAHLVPWLLPRGLAWLKRAT